MGRSVADRFVSVLFEIVPRRAAGRQSRPHDTAVLDVVGRARIEDRLVVHSDRLRFRARGWCRYRHAAALHSTVAVIVVRHDDYDDNMPDIKPKSLQHSTISLTICISIRGQRVSSR